MEAMKQKINTQFQNIREYDMVSNFLRLDKCFRNNSLNKQII